jgi:hypothetical protein
MASGLVPRILAAAPVHHRQYSDRGRICEADPKNSDRARPGANPSRSRACVRSRSDRQAKPLEKRDDGEMKRGDDESEFYREIIRRAKRVRERAAESLRLSRRRAKGKEDAGAAPRPRRKG